jgi:hypothetical protein
MWDCAVCGTTSIINEKFCPQCFTARPPELTGQLVEAAETEAGEMAESDSKAPEEAGADDSTPVAGKPVSEADSGPESAGAGGGGYSEAEPSSGGFLTDWGR